MVLEEFIANVETYNYESAFFSHSEPSMNPTIFPDYLSLSKLRSTPVIRHFRH